MPFFLISVGLHLLLLFFSRPNPPGKELAIEQIPVSVLPGAKEGKPEAPKAVQRAESRPAKAAVQVAKKSAPLPEETAKQPLPPPVKEESREIPARPDREKYTIVQRPLPTLKELLPPVTWSSPRERASDKEGPVRLDTQDPKYVSYTTSIKRAIELVWEYPEPALRQGLQGKLVLEFPILGDGQLEGTRLVRSSGFPILDQEAMRAVQAASPFHPIPPWIGKTRMDVVASFEYHDNRLKYGLVP